LLSKSDTENDINEVIQIVKKPKGTLVNAETYVHGRVGCAPVVAESWKRRSIGSGADVVMLLGTINRAWNQVLGAYGPLECRSSLPGSLFAKISEFGFKCCYLERDAAEVTRGLQQETSLRGIRSYISSL
jgi:hypothetical protein